MIFCDCRIDWVCCLRSNCPRAQRIREEQQKQYEAARRWLGDPTKGVHFPTVPVIT